MHQNVEWFILIGRVMWDYFSVYYTFVISNTISISITQQVKKSVNIKFYFSITIN